VRFVSDVTVSAKIVSGYGIRKINARWQTRLEQLELWVVSYPIENKDPRSKLTGYSDE
jgi:hypothetical protein